MADAPEVKVKFSAEGDGAVISAIRELQTQLKNTKKQADETASSTFNLKKAFDALASSFLAIKLAEFAKSAFDSAVNIGRMADKTGQTTQQLSVFHHVAEEMGIQTEVVDKALVKAAKSITLFEQGSKQAAQGFALLGLKQKDFAGLNTDQKVLLVTNALGKMAAGAQKATAAQLILSKGGAEFIPIANAIAAEGYGKIADSASKLGLLLTRDMTDAAQAAQASLGELEGAAKGLATQFEAGLLPAISDVADAILESTDISGKSGDGFREMGQAAGNAIRYIALAFITMGVSIAAEATNLGLVVIESFTEIEISGTHAWTAIGAAARGHWEEAKRAWSDGSRDIQRAQAELAQQQKAVWDDAAVHIRKSMESILPSDQEEARRQRERTSKRRPDKTDEEAKADLFPKSANDAAEKAAFSLLQKQLQDELAIRRAYAKQADEVEKEQYDQGLISLSEYFARRRAAVVTDAADEVAILEKEKANAQAEADKAAAAMKSASTPKDKDKEDAARLQALAKVDDLETKIRVTRIDADTKIHALNIEESKDVDDLQKKRLTFENELLVAQGKTFEAARQKIIAEGEEMKDSRALAKSGLTPADVDKLTQTRLQTQAFEEQQKAEQYALQANADKRDEVMNRVKTGQIFEAQGEREIKKIEEERLAILSDIAAQTEARAEVTGEAADKAQAANATKTYDDQKAQLDETGQNVEKLRASVQGGLTTGFTNFFETVGRGTATVAQSFAALAGSVVGSMQKALSQMMAVYLMKKLLGGGDSNSDNSDNSDGGGDGGGGGGGLLGGLMKMFKFAGGGLIKGPGSGTSDSITARLSSGEFVMKASAVSAFGAHNLEAINRGMKMPSIASMGLPKFSEGGLVGASGSASPSSINLGIGLDQGLILHHLSSKDAGRIILQHLTNNPKAAGKALGRSQT